MATQEDKEKNEALSSWRLQNWKSILDKNKQVLESIRDDPEAHDKNKIEAIKTLSRIAAILQPESIAPPSKDKVGEKNKKPELSEEELKDLDAYL